MNEFLLEAFKIEYRKENPGKPASMNRVHFSNWLVEKLYDIANELDDDEFFEFQCEYIEKASKTLYKKYQKSFED